MKDRATNTPLLLSDNEEDNYAKDYDSNDKSNNREDYENAIEEEVVIEVNAADEEWHNQFAAFEPQFAAFESLPPEMREHIFQFLSLRDKVNLGQASKTFYHTFSPNIYSLAPTWYNFTRKFNCAKIAPDTESSALAASFATIFVGGLFLGFGFGYNDSTQIKVGASTLGLGVAGLISTIGCSSYNKFGLFKEEKAKQIAALNAKTEVTEEARLLAPNV